MFMDWKMKILNISIPPKVIYIVNAIKMPILFFIELEKNSKIHVEQKTPRSQGNCEQKNRAGKVTLPNSKLDYILLQLNSGAPQNKTQNNHIT